ncbi:hypothetical protein DB30_00233 [Enhygromyxa salina]|uniref:DUF427 domain-containing protein n=1 Tax=Enhygromyxa salina TaxID=215803 RepID=A0A0C2A549_9BACT|nr:DUF427 domain-containing protein [Enhygromyxa salina]KIG18548.1 hypothetical protein DB30_00233 [Enhygromyxa salina]
MRAIWNGETIAQSDDTVVVEGNHYFPRRSIVAAHFAESDTQTVCPWKGTARYLTVEVNGQRNVDAAWYYPAPKEAAKQIADRVAFWRGVEVVE